MEYKHIVQGRFLERPNRFIAKVEIGNMKEQGREDCSVEIVHVKNTGRCRELLQKGARVYLERSDNPNRNTAYDLVAVEKGKRLINMDSQAPNKAVEEWLRAGAFLSDVLLVRPEVKYGSSRFDFYMETAANRIFMEVKGVTLEEDGVILFPDAPSDRAVKHVEELIQARHAGYRCFVLFVIQMENVKYFTPNRRTHFQFAEALCRAEKAGVEILAYDCLITPESMRINRPVPVILCEEKGTMKTNEMRENTSKKVSGRTGETEESVYETLRKTSEKNKLEAISTPLLKWYDENRRILPWRENPTPYRVWVSEIMLQQTRVEAVKPYFERFMKELPDIEALAAADEEILLKLWEGLGYYNRVRNLKKAAIQIQKEHGGEMPDTYKELLTLTGIGNYTAGAIASIAFQRPVPAVDGNVLRVISRLTKDPRPINEAKVKECVERDLKEVIPQDRPGDFNQAMMEIGACVCIPNGVPLCGSCPLREFCAAHKAGAVQDYPKREVKRPRQIEDRTILLIMNESRTAVRKRPGRGLLAGMYEFPSIDGFRTAEEVAGYLAERGLRAIGIQPLEDAKHIFTHKEWHMKGYMVKVDRPESGKTKGFAEDWLYIEPEETRDRYPIPSAFSAYTKYLSIRLGRERYEPGKI
nr:A/G-specific adenine glycosylase [uncultured Acetatifactor sp.]